MMLDSDDEDESVDYYGKSVKKKKKNTKSIAPATINLN